MGRRKPKKVKSLADLGVDDPLAVVPEIEPGVEAKRDNKQLLQVRRKMEPKPGLYGWFSRVLKYRHEIRVNLDEAGTFFWGLLDGRRTIGRIADAMAERFGTEQAEARKSAVLFAKALMNRRLIHLRIDANKDKQYNTESQP